MSSTTIQYELIRESEEDDGEELISDLEIEVDIDAGCPAKLTGHPDTWEPADSGYQEIDSITETVPLYGPYQEGKRVKYACIPWEGELTLSEREEIFNQAMESLEADAESAAGEAYLESQQDREEAYYDRHGY